MYKVLTISLVTIQLKQVVREKKSKLDQDGMQWTFYVQRLIKSVLPLSLSVSAILFKRDFSPYNNRNKCRRLIALKMYSASA